MWRGLYFETCGLHHAWLGVKKMLVCCWCVYVDINIYKNIYLYIYLYLYIHTHVNKLPNFTCTWGSEREEVGLFMHGWGYIWLHAASPTPNKKRRIHLTCNPQLLLFSLPSSSLFLTILIILTSSSSLSTTTIHYSFTSSHSPWGHIRCAETAR